MSVSFDGADPVTLLTLTPDTPTAYNETVTVRLNTPEGAKEAVIIWDHQGKNNWWWAIDNIKITTDAYAIDPKDAWHHNLGAN